MIQLLFIEDVEMAHRYLKIKKFFKKKAEQRIPTVECKSLHTPWFLNEGKQERVYRFVYTNLQKIEL